MLWVDPKDESEFWGKIKRETISDHVILGHQDFKKLMEMLGISESPKDADLFFNGTVPLPNIRITIPDYNSWFDGGVLEADVVIFQESLSHINSFSGIAGDENYLIIGAVVFCGTIYQLLEVSKYGDRITLGFSGIRPSIRTEDNKVKKQIARVITNPQYDEIMRRLAGTICNAWYVIQIAMLNPMTREVFSAPRISTEGNNKAKKKAKQKVRYIRNHYLTADKLEKVLNQYKGTKKYTCLAWYVCGHWRTYKNGRRIFIQPYWKGTMRDQRMKLGDISRTREIAQLNNCLEVNYV